MVRHIILACGLVWSASAKPALAATTAPRRIVSLNLCADQLVLALADRSSIAGVTRNATSAELSAQAAAAAGLRQVGSSMEEVLAVEPDLLVGTPSPALSSLLARRSYARLDLPPAESLGAIRLSIGKVAAGIGQRARGEALIAQMDRDLVAIPRNGRGRVAVYYQRRGYVTGTGTLVDELMARAGLVNLAARIGRPVLSQMPIEEIVAARPDFLIIDSANVRITDQGTEMLHHPALRSIPRIRIPQAWTVCGSPAFVQAARAIADQIAAHDRGRSSARGN